MQVFRIGFGEIDLGIFSLSELSPAPCDFIATAEDSFRFSGILLSTHRPSPKFLLGSTLTVCSLSSTHSPVQEAVRAVVRVSRSVREHVYRVSSATMVCRRHDGYAIDRLARQSTIPPLCSRHSARESPSVELHYSIRWA